jgi:hypothetical protein
LFEEAMKLDPEERAALIIKQDIEVYYVASVPALRGCPEDFRGATRLPRITCREAMAALRKVSSHAFLFACLS